MAFPNTIDATVGGAEQPGKFATFLHGTDRYQIQFLLDGLNGTATLMAMKSSDSGATWVEVDMVGHPTGQWAGPGSIFPYTCVQTSVTVIRVIYLDITGAIVDIIPFDMNTNLWGASGAAVVPPAGAYNGLGQWSAVYRSATNDIVFVNVGDQISLNDVNHRICWAGLYDIAGDSWSTIGDLGYQDYSDITAWDQVPCGVLYDSGTGLTHVFMQQVALAGPGNEVLQQFSVDSTITFPLDTPTQVTANLWGAGGGGSPGTTEGGGGGGGAFETGLVTIIPGNTYPVTVGIGGATGADGTATVFETVTATPGLQGTVSPGGLGGAGGVGTHDGGKGGDPGAATGGGGGGSGTPTAAGNDGAIGGASLGGAGGTGQGQGGTGGAGNLIDPSQGQPGGIPGAGGGGHGSGFVDPGGNNGGDGEADITWTKIRNTHDCRMWQQAILADNSLGTLTEITDGAYPSRAKDATPVPISFDCAIRNGKVRITFTGATLTSGRDDIAVGKGDSADPVVFSLDTFSCGNGGNNVDSCPAVAMGSLGTFCCYISAPDGSDISFLYRLDSGSGFGSTVTIGALTPPDDREFGRLQASVLVSAPEITFGTPTAASIQLSIPD